MPESTAAPGPADPAPGPAGPEAVAPPRRARAGVAWRIGWVLLAAVSMGVTYAALVVIGR